MVIIFLSNSPTLFSFIKPIVGEAVFIPCTPEFRFVEAEIAFLKVSVIRIESDRASLGVTI